MADCICENIEEGIEKDCSNNRGGLKSPMWIAPKCNVASVTLNSPEGKIGTITMEAGTYFHPFEFNKNTSNYTEVETMDETSGSISVIQTITLLLNKREKTKRDKLALLDKFRDLVVICKDSNDEIVMFGETEGMIMKTNEGGSGTAKTDRNGYTITFTGDEPELANTVTAAALAAVLAP